MQASEQGHADGQTPSDASPPDEPDPPAPGSPPRPGAGVGAPTPTSATNRSDRRTFRRPPLTVRPLNAGRSSTPPSSAELTHHRTFENAGGLPYLPPSFVHTVSVMGAQARKLPRGPLAGPAAAPDSSNAAISSSE
jgi:hypothetical protein